MDGGWLWETKEQRTKLTKREQERTTQEQRIGYAAGQTILIVIAFNDKGRTILLKRRTYCCYTVMKGQAILAGEESTPTDTCTSTGIPYIIYTDQRVRIL